MKKEIPNPELKPFGRRVLKLNQKIVTFLFFLVLSFIFWLLNVLDHNYSTNVEYPIKYIHHYNNQTMVGEIPASLSLNLSGQGYALMRNIFTSSSHPLSVSVISLKLDTLQDDTTKLFILTRNLKEYLQRQLSNEVTLNYITPDTLYYTFSPVIRKKVPIEPDIDIEYEKQYMLGGNIISAPDCVIISGPQSILDTISFVKTEKKKFQKVDKSFRTNAKLVMYPDVYYVKKQSDLIVPVDKYTESTMSIPIKVINLPDSLTIKIFPPNVNITYNVSLNNYNKVSPRMFRFIVDYRNIDQSINNKLKVMLEHQPPYVNTILYKPRNVDYIIQKK